MRYIWEDLESLEIGDKVVYDIEDGHNVHVMIMTYDNYTNFRYGQHHQYFGGVATDNKVSINVPFKSNWVAVAFAYPFGFVKNCKISVNKCVGEYKKKDVVIDTSLALSKNIDESQKVKYNEFYNLIHTFENNVRAFITYALIDAYGEDEYVNRGIAKSILNEAEHRLKQEQDLNIKFEIEVTIIHYVDFPQLKEIIVGKNWSKVFEKLCKSKSSVIHLFDKIADFRRPVAHNRSIDVSEIERLKLYITDWDENIKK